MFAPIWVHCGLVNLTHEIDHPSDTCYNAYKASKFYAKRKKTTHITKDHLYVIPFKWNIQSKQIYRAERLVAA